MVADWSPQGPSGFGGFAAGAGVDAAHKRQNWGKRAITVTVIIPPHKH